MPTTTRLCDHSPEALRPHARDIIACRTICPVCRQPIEARRDATLPLPGLPHSSKLQWELRPNALWVQVLPFGFLSIFGISAVICLILTIAALLWFLLGDLRLDSMDPKYLTLLFLPIITAIVAILAGTGYELEFNQQHLVVTRMLSGARIRHQRSTANLKAIIYDDTVIDEQHNESLHLIFHNESEIVLRYPLSTTEKRWLETALKYMMAIASKPDSQPKT